MDCRSGTQAVEALCTKLSPEVALNPAHELLRSLACRSLSGPGRIDRLDGSVTAHILTTDSLRDLLL